METNNLEKAGSGLAIGYKDFLQEILTKIQTARYEMLMSVSKRTLLLYWDIGKSVSKKTKSGGWGQSVVEKLSKDLQTEFPGVRGFSARNIWRMKTFYEFYSEFLFSAPSGAEIVTLTEQSNSATAVAEFLSPLITEVGWVQNCIILEKCKDLKQIVFYLKMTKEKGWSKYDLLEKINAYLLRKSQIIYE